MPISRYDERRLFTNFSNDYVYSDIFKKRNISQITQYSTAILNYPSPEELIEIERNTVVWGTGTKYFNLAYEYYGDPEYWWIIAWFNLRPLETDYRPGDIVVVPTPLESVLSALELL